MVAKIIEIHVPEYHLHTKPDYLNVGRKVDAEIEKNLPDGQYVYRAIGKDDHPNLSLNEFVETVLKLGTDKYNPKRKEVCFGEVCMYDHDIQAGSFDIKKHKIILDSSYEYPSMFGDTVKKFYENVLLDRGYRVRIDVLIIYDANKLVKAKKIDPKAESARPELEECLYKFKEPEHKQDALVGIVKILIKFNENTIKYFHKELLKYVEKDEKHRGEYKKQENKVHMINEAGESVGVFFDTTPAYLTPKEMQELVEWTIDVLENKKYHPLLTIGNFLVEFLNIHPFLDGNGRISRVLTNLLLLKAGYEYMPYVSHEKLVEDSKPEYYIALRRSQKKIRKKSEDITPWLNFFLNIFLEQSKRAVELLSKENIEKLLSPKQLAVWKYLITVSEATPAEISKHAKVARPTINQALDKLLRLKKIERIGLGRTTRYKKI